MKNNFDVIIVGGGAAGLFCAANLGAKGFNTLVLEHNKVVGKKIKISGGGRCNFTNVNATFENYLSENPHFCKSALAKFTAADFIDLVKKHGINFHEKHLGQLFCNDSSNDIINLLLKLCHDSNVTIKCSSTVESIEKDDNFKLIVNSEIYESNNLVLACGGLSLPTIGASDFGHRIAKKFGHKITSLKPGLVPLTIQNNPHALLSGVAMPVILKCKKIIFNEDMLFTHKGLSGPGILQISSYLDSNEKLVIDFLPKVDIESIILSSKKGKTNFKLSHFFKDHLPKKFIEHWFSYYEIKDDFIKGLSDNAITECCNHFKNFELLPSGTEGYRKAEVTVGGVSTDKVDSKSMQSKLCKGLFLIGEVIDVTGWLGGYNFQWAWASAYACASNMEKIAAEAK